MPKHILLIILSFVVGSAVAQDTIITRSGEVIPAKVLEITPTEIKYKKPSNPDGPLYVASKENVAVIQYKNGTKDVFKLEESDDVYTNSTQGNQSGNNYTPRPRVNVVVAPPPIVIGTGWGYYRPHRHIRHNHWWRWGCGWWW